MISVLERVAARYPTELVTGQQADIPRIAFHIQLAIESVSPKRSSEIAVCDLGGGIGLFSIGCAAMEFRRVVLVDDFRDSINKAVGDSPLELHKSYGVEVVRRNVIAQGLTGLEGPFDVFTCFDSMEHWHHSPKQLFREAVEKLREGGALILGVPNCVNLRKRITVPFGRGKWSSMQDWYEADEFRGHVREPDVADLAYIAADLGLSDWKIVGRNWLGYPENRALRGLAFAVDHALRFFPALCSNIYLVGKKA
jgi:2-polyprenyl-3-methyl-5-hydroxy-6-metoxy-1,4-benzoquinol methylase